MYVCNDSGREGTGTGEAYIALSLHVGSFVQEHLHHFNMTIHNGVVESSVSTLSETDTHCDRAYIHGHTDMQQLVIKCITILQCTTQCNAIAHTDVGALIHLLTNIIIYHVLTHVILYIYLRMYKDKHARTEVHTYIYTYIHKSTNTT